MIEERTGRKQTTNGEVLEELVRELRYLRGLVREVGENFILRREGEIEAVVSNLDDLPPGKLRAISASQLHDFRNLTVKPAKGRLKDLKRLNVLIEELTDQVVNVQKKDKGSGKGSQAGRTVAALGSQDSRH